MKCNNMCEKCGDDNCDGSGGYDDYIDPVDVITELYPDKKFFYLEDYIDAIVGISGNKLVYSKSVIIDILCDESEMDFEEAIKYYENNIENGFFGDKTPIFLNDDLSLIIENMYEDLDKGMIAIPFSPN